MDKLREHPADPYALFRGGLRYLITYGIENHAGVVPGGFHHGGDICLPV